MNKAPVEIIPAILRKTYEDIKTDWNKIYTAAHHIQLDITDGIFAGEGTFRELKRFKQLPESEKIELHMMVHTPALFLADIIDLLPARCIFHLESFSGSDDLHTVFTTIKEHANTEVALAVNPETPSERLEEQLDLIDYVLFMGYNPGWANQPLNPIVYNKVRGWAARHPSLPIAVDGHVNRTTAARFVAAGATRLCANTAIFGRGNPVANLAALTTAAHQHTVQK